jgi:hypothetical protein
LVGKRYKEEKKAVGENQYTSKTTEDIKRVDHSEPPKTTAQKIAAIKQSLPNLDKNGGNSYHESRQNLDKAETKIAEQSKVNQNQPTGILLKGLE